MTQEPNRLVNGLDYHGNLCGITNFLTPGGEDVINLPKAYPLPSGFFVCVESCPNTNNFDKFICEYEVQHDIDVTLGAAAGIGSNGVGESISANRSIYLLYTGKKQCMPLIESTSFLGYCIPNLPLKDVLLSTDGTRNESEFSSAQLTQENNGNMSSLPATRANGTAYNNESISVSVTAEKKATSKSDVFDMAMADVHTVRYVICIFGCGVAMTLGILFLVIIQLPGLLSLLVWSMIIAVDVGFVAAGYYTKGVSATWETSGRPGNEALALYYGSYVLYGLAAVWCVMMLFLRKRILLAIACVKEASRAISAMPLMTVFPVIQVLSLSLFTIVWGVYMAYLASSGEIEASCICPIFDQGFPEFFDDEVSPAPTPAMASNRFDGNDSCGEGCFVYKELTYSITTKYAGL
jgi:choline transporter-like protein 2/4/5